MTTDKADALVQNALAYRNSGPSCSQKYLERVRQELGAVTVARFVQVEDQLLLIIDLQIDSSLPLVRQHL